jgi:hypothetical protein
MGVASFWGLRDRFELSVPDERWSWPLTWFRGSAARKYDSSQRKTGRPRKARDIRKLVVKMALENLNWGYTKIRDALRTGLKIEIGRTTVADILAEEGIEPAPEREKKRTWKQFLKSSSTTCPSGSTRVLVANSSGSSWLPRITTAPQVRLFVAHALVAC